MTSLLCMSRYGQKLDKSPFQKNQSFHDFYFQISLSHSFQTEESLRSSYLVLTLALTLTKNFMYLLNISDFIFFNFKVSFLCKCNTIPLGKSSKQVQKGLLTILYRVQLQTYLDKELKGPEYN